MSALISAIPILLLIVLMMGFKVSGYRSAIVTLIVTILLALFVTPYLGIIPEKYAEASIYGITLWSVIEGFLKACFPITRTASDVGSWWCARGYGRLWHRSSHSCSHFDRIRFQTHVLSRYLFGGKHCCRRFRSSRSSSHHSG